MPLPMLFIFISASGLSAIQESNPDAILVAHAKTRHRIGIILLYCFPFIKSTF